MRLLIVDDNSHFLEAARHLLEREGMAVVGVASTIRRLYGALASYGPKSPSSTSISATGAASISRGSSPTRSGTRDQR